jgi:DNA-binding NtrC family response regulator
MTATILKDNCSLEVKPGNYSSNLSTGETSEAAMAKPRILVIDDDACFCELLCLYFMAKGFDVVTARTETEAERLVDQGRFDLVILDWYLNGSVTLDLLNRSKKRHPAIPVILFTGAEVELFLKAALAGRVDGVVRKMGSLESLSSQVCHYLGWPELRVVK